jgi:hypothetical protein
MIELTNELLIKILFFLLIFTLIYQILIKVFKERTTSALIALAASLISTFYLTASQLSFLEKTYTIGGTAILITVPFIIIFLFVYTSNLESFLRKLIWIFYSILTIILLQKNKNLQEQDLVLITAIIIIACFILLVLDKWIKNQINSKKAIPKKR